MVENICKHSYTFSNLCEHAIQITDKIVRYSDAIENLDNLDSFGLGHLSTRIVQYSNPNRTPILHQDCFIGMTSILTK